MPKETKEAVKWALQQFHEEEEVSIPVKNVSHLIVDYTRKYFNNNGIPYETFSLKDIKPYISTN